MRQYKAGYSNIILRIIEFWLIQMSILLTSQFKCFHMLKNLFEMVFPALIIMIFKMFIWYQIRRLHISVRN